jgi:hypothetical protein
MISTAIRAVAAAAVVCPDGNDQPLEAASRSIGRGRAIAFSTSVRSVTATGSATATNTADRHRRPASKARQPTAATGAITVVLPVTVIAAIAARQAGWARASRRAASLTARSTAAGCPACAITAQASKPKRTAATRAVGTGRRLIPRTLSPT